ncbi:hypothetical protein FPRO03_11600 [Fusarium proliferatum]|nr:hypothetical protein FPRO03_11600 [Fusarium proliferatum]
MASPSKAPQRSDMILAMNDLYMQQIVDGTKTYEFRKYNMAGIKRIWLYRTAPHSAITHICPVNEAVTRNSGDAPLHEDGLGNKEYNEKNADYEGYDFAYRINAVYEIQAEGGRGITWAMMRDEHGMKIAPRGRVRVPESMIEQYRLEDQKKVLVFPGIQLLRLYVIKFLVYEVISARLSAAVPLSGRTYTYRRVWSANKTCPYYLRHCKLKPMTFAMCSWQCSPDPPTHATVSLPLWALANAHIGRSTYIPQVNGLPFQAAPSSSDYID